MNPLLTMEPYKSYFEFKKSPDTRAGYASDFYMFKKKTGVWLHEATEKQLLDYLTERREKEEVCDNSLSRYKGGFGAFFKWLQATHRRPDNPGLALLLFTTEPKQGRPKALNEAQRTQLIASLRWDTLHEYQMSLFVYLGMDTGLRVSELCKLKWSDIDLGKATIKSLRKGRKQWTGRIPNGKPLFTLDKLKQYQNQYGDKSEWIFFQQYHATERKTKFGALYWTEMLKQRLGWGKEIKFTPHVLRHIFCTRLADAGVRDEIAIKMTGHAGVDVYKKNYVKVEEEAVDGESKRVLG